MRGHVGYWLAAMSSAACSDAASAPSAPAEVPGLALWLDAADAGTVILEGEGVKEWRDRSGKGRHLAQPDADARPRLSRQKQNGHPLLSFDGAAQFLTGPAALPAGQACLNLVVDGKVVRTATGPNDKPGGSKRLDWAEWSVADLAGKTATIQIVD